MQKGQGILREKGRDLPIMKRWSYIRHKLENEYLAESLRGHLQYFAASYSKCHDHEGRAAIRLDGEEILKSSYFEKMILQSREFHRLYDNGAGSFGECWYRAFDEAENCGGFDQRTFYAAFGEFDSQDIETSLASESLIVRIFAVLDRRVGKRRLRKMLDEGENENVIFQMFLYIRCESEGLLCDTGVNANSALAVNRKNGYKTN